MYVEPLQERELLASELPVDTWEGDEARRDAVWLAASDLWLRRTFLSGSPVQFLDPSPEDVRVAGASYACSIFRGCPPPTLGEPVFLFTGDILKFAAEFGDAEHVRPAGEIAVYQRLAERIATEAAQRWDLLSVDRYAALQTLTWSVQSIRIRTANDEFEPSTAVDLVHQVVNELGFGQAVMGA